VQLKQLERLRELLNERHAERRARREERIPLTNFQQ
jgi:hypothetical protein